MAKRWQTMAEMTCPNGHRFSVPDVLAQGPGSRSVNRAKLSASPLGGGVFTRGRRQRRYSVMVDQQARAAEARRCPVCSAFAAEPGFYPDPDGVARARWWDGAQWTSTTK